MICSGAQSLITKYVQDQLDLKTLEEFLQHVTSCDDCLEELEVYYIVFTGIKHLDTDENIAINYHEEFIRSIAKNQQKIRHSKRLHYGRRIIFVALLVAIMLLSNFSLSKYEIEDTMIYRTDGISEFALPIHFEHRTTVLDEYLFQYLGMEYELSPNTKDNVMEFPRIEERLEREWSIYE